MSFSSDNFCNTDSEVEKYPVEVFFKPLVSIFNFSNKISLNCFGESILNTLPDAS